MNFSYFQTNYLKVCEESMPLQENLEKRNKISFIGIGRTENGFITFGSSQKDFTEEMENELKNKLDKFISGFEIYNIGSFPGKKYKVPEYYIESFKEPYNYSNWNLSQGFSEKGRLSLIDWWTFLKNGKKEKITKYLFNDFKESAEFNQINEKAEIEKALKNYYPKIGDCGLDKILKNRIWKHLKKKNQEQLSTHSKRALKNGERGKDFEKLFKEMCQESGLNCYKKSGKAFKENLPTKYNRIKKIKGNMKGIPDFFVDKGNTHSLDEWIENTTQRKWEPKKRYAFVECKYNNSPLSKDQKEMIKLLKKHKIEVYIFRGSKNNFKYTKYIK